VGLTLATIAILTNALAADQRSMIGYGEMLLVAAGQSGRKVVEFRPASLFGRLLPRRLTGLSRKLANNLDRFIVTPIKLFGKRPISFTSSIRETLFTCHLSVTASPS
jgi:hypothetical protein